MLGMEDFERPYPNEGRPLYVLEEERRPQENGETVLMQEESGNTVPAQDENFESFIINYNASIHGPVGAVSDEFFQIINDMFAVLYVP